MKAGGLIVGLAIGAVAGIVVGSLVIGGGGGKGGMEETAGSTEAVVPMEKPVKLKMASAFGSAWPIQGELGLRFVDQIHKVSDGSITVQFFEPGALVPALEIFDAVSQGSVDAGWTTAGYWAGKIPAAQFFTSVPFGPDAMEYAAWLYDGGGMEMWEQLYAPYNIIPINCGVHSPEGSGWFRKPINSMEDLKGLKMRFFGLGARVMEKMGVSTQLLAGGDIYPALELGTIDATEYSMPIIDLNQGFYQIAKHYYFPGWHQPSSLFELIVNKDRWDAMSETQRTQIRSVCGDNYRFGLGLAEAAQAKALTELKAKGVIFHRWPDDILAKFREGWEEVAAEEAAKDENFKKVYASFTAFRDEYAVWRKLGYVN